ncbi:apolipoprotein N-acyltransferase [Nocardioides piscis]|uniref:apolipoprotein N-acyltransferase n=1 Tax=Nocardioides piscis TaxID=2714938 RepID=UPI001FE5497F|nr:apolipoprotein N-acyltransferase [Nocardioides piscis]
MAFSFDPIGLAWLAPFALTAFVTATGPRRQSWRRAGMAGFSFGAVFFAVHIWWLATSISPAAWIAVSLTQGLWFAGLGALVRLLWRQRMRVLSIPACWTAIELARSQWPFGGFPWGQLGFTSIGGPWAGTLPYVGVEGTSFLIALAGTAGAAAWAARTTPKWPRMGRIAALASIVCAAPVGAVLFPYSVSADGTLRIAAVQGGIPGGSTDVMARHRQITRAHAAATVKMSDRIRAGDQEAVDLLVWPESSVIVDPTTDEVARRQVERAVAASDAPILLGAIVDGPSEGTALNQGLVWSIDGPSDERYTKRHPVPFGEYIPFRPWLSGFSPRFDEIPRDMLPGEPTPPLNVTTDQGRLLVASAICFDVAFTDVLVDQVRAGAHLAVIQSSNAAFTGSSQPEQQFTISRARALETGRAVVVASLNGVSGIVFPDGTVRTRSQSPDTQALTSTVPLVTALTPAVRFAGARNSMIAVIAVAASSAAFGRSVRRRTRRFLMVTSPGWGSCGADSAERNSSQGALNSASRTDTIY